MTTPSSERYALFKGRKQVSKAHSTRQACVTEAFERGGVYHRAQDFGGEGGEGLAPGYSIRKVTSDE